MDQLVAGARRELAQAAALGAEDERHRPGEVEVVDRARRVLGGADDADVALLQLAERSRQVGDHEVRHRLGSAARDLGDGRVDADGVVLRRDHGVRAGAVGDAQAGAEVVRVGDAVEDEDERRLAARFGRLERVVERVAARDRLDDRDDALVAVVAGETAQALVVAVDEAHLGGFGTRDELAHALVAPAGVDVDFDDRARRRLQAHADRVEAEQEVACHRRMVATSQSTPISTGWCSM